MKPNIKKKKKSQQRRKNFSISDYLIENLHIEEKYMPSKSILENKQPIIGKIKVQEMPQSFA